MIVHTGEWTPADRVASPYRYLPAHVPDGAAGIRVRLAYPADAGVLDLGCIGPDGFRGWSGGARDEFVITAGHATPGYLPGRPEPGEWHVVLGLYRVPARLPYEVTVTVLSEAPEPPPVTAPPVPDRPPRRNPPAPPGRRWLAGDLHCHSHHSDGTGSVPELAAAAVSAGLDFLAVTDHNTVSHHRELDAVSRRYGVHLIPGQEITTDRGHANAFGDIGWIDFRASAAEWFAEVARRGGVVSVNHPIATDCAWQFPLDAPPPAAEIWHSTWHDTTWRGPLAWWLAAGPAVVPVGGSDYHSPDGAAPLGRPVTWLCVPDSAPVTTEALLDALRTGAVAVGADRTGPAILPGDATVNVATETPVVLADFTGRRRIVPAGTVSLPAEPGAHWIEDFKGAVVALCRVG
ncbi:PHP domain-containing protein [Stackebrandtia albiflava]|uniref:PHP domain-containing protein n=1 Tax=Stackebrandtia albiflava TaxID=406432 RepID=A0A562VBT6_9ACTN|nr:CehA/McbA family metallohydrolase [Stackebrandtia albiflava]TWJ15339.1 PHP domain-containing protein [Stackebrandtia albiflava]